MRIKRYREAMLEMGGPSKAEFYRWLKDKVCPTAGVGPDPLTRKQYPYLAAAAKDFIQRHRTHFESVTRWQHTRSGQRPRQHTQNMASVTPSRDRENEDEDDDEDNVEEEDAPSPADMGRQASPMPRSQNHMPTPQSLRSARSLTPGAQVPDTKRSSASRARSSPSNKPSSRSMTPNSP